MSFSGEHYSLAEVTFLPAPAQERLPIWSGGNWPSKRPFRRAARMEGVIPERGGGELLTPSEVREALAFVAEEKERQGIDPGGPYDVATAGYTPPGDASAWRSVVEPYVEAGATWWIERFLPDRGPLDLTRERLSQGPPRLERPAACAVVGGAVRSLPTRSRPGPESDRYREHCSIPAGAH